MHFILLSNESCINRGCNYFKTVFCVSETMLGFCFPGVSSASIFFCLANSKESLHSISQLSWVKPVVFLEVAMTFTCGMVLSGNKCGLFWNLYVMLHWSSGTLLRLLFSEKLGHQPCVLHIVKSLKIDTTKKQSLGNFYLFFPWMSSRCVLFA